MKILQFLSLVGLVLACSLNATAAGDDEVYLWGDDYPGAHQRREGVVQLAIGGSAMAGLDEYLSASPKLNIGITAFPNDNLGFYSELSYYSLDSRFRHAHITGFDIGARARLAPTAISPFVRAGLNLSYFDAVSYGRDLNELRPGVSLGMGIDLRLASWGSLDLALTKVLNHRKSQLVYTDVPLPNDEFPPPYLGSAYELDDDFYNPTALTLQYRYPL